MTRRAEPRKRPGYPRDRDASRAAMGVSINYCAIPPHSALFVRASREKPLAVLIVDLYRCGSLYSFLNIDPDEQRELLDWALEDHPDVFESAAELEHWFAEYRSEVERTLAQCPGIQHRWATMEKTSFVIEDRLRSHFAKSNGMDGNAMVDRLMFGDQRFAGSLFAPADSGLGLITPQFAREGAKLLAGLDADRLFPEHEARDENAREQYQMWRDLFSVAAAKKEAILVGIN